VASDPVEVALKGFTRWAKNTPQMLMGEPGADARELRLLLGLLRDDVGIDDPAALRPGDIDELLLRVYPRKVTVLDAEDTVDTVPAVRDLLVFLADTGAVTGEAAKRLAHELDEVAPQFSRAVMDPKNWGVARAITQAMASDGVDFGDRDAVDRWIVHHNAHMNAGTVGDEDPFDDFGEDKADDEDFDLKDAFGLPDRLPPLRLPCEQELAAMSRTAPLLERVRRLAEWAGPGRGVTWDGELTAGDSVAAARVLGIDVPLETAVRRDTASSRNNVPKGQARPAGRGDRRDDAVLEALPGMPAPPAVKSMRNVPELARLWSIALAAGLLEPDADGARVEPGEAMRCWPGGTDEEALDVWCTALASVLDLLEVDSVLGTRRRGQLDFCGVGGALMVMLFLARGAGLPIREASGMIRETATAELLPVPAAKAWKSWIRAHGDPAEVLLARLAELGAVSLADQGVQEGQVARLTPLGMWAMREQLLDEGVEIPLLPPVGEMTAADLVAAAESVDEAEAAAETAAWLELRTPDAAASELLAVAASGGVVERMLAVAAVNRLGAAAEPAWRDSLSRPELRPYAKIALTEIAGGSPGLTMLAGLEPEAGDIAWVLTDMLAALSDSPEELPQLLRESVPVGQEQQVFDAMSQLAHPDVAGVLSLIGKHHPDKRIAKAARRSAYRAGSRPKQAS